MSIWYGCAHAAPQYPVRTTEQDIAIYGTDTIRDLGFDTAKIYLTPTYATVYPNQNFGSTPTNLTELAQTAPMVHILGDITLPRIVITTYTFANTVNSPLTDLTPTNLANEYTEIYNLCVHLLSTYSNKTFILQNAEGDWELLGNVDPGATLDSTKLGRYAAFMKKRIEAVRAAQLATSTTSTVQLAIEMNRVLDNFGYRLYRDVLSKAMPDLISLTIYESINTWTNQAGTEAAIEANLTETVRKIRHALGNTIPIYIGEFTWPQDESSFTSHNLNVPALMDKVISVAESLGIKGAIWWQCFDNESQSPGVPRGFGMYDRNGNSNTPGPLNDAGLHWQEILT